MAFSPCGDVFKVYRSPRVTLVRSGRAVSSATHPEVTPGTLHHIAPDTSRRRPPRRKDTWSWRERTSRSWEAELEGAPTLAGLNARLACCLGGGLRLRHSGGGNAKGWTERRVLWLDFFVFLAAVVGRGQVAGPQRSAGTRLRDGGGPGEVHPMVPGPRSLFTNRRPDSATRKRTTDEWNSPPSARLPHPSALALMDDVGDEGRARVPDFCWRSATPAGASHLVVRLMLGRHHAGDLIGVILVGRASGGCQRATDSGGRRCGWCGGRRNSFLPVQPPTSRWWGVSPTATTAADAEAKTGGYLPLSFGSSNNRSLGAA